MEHQLSHDKNQNKCVFCEKELEDIMEDGEEYDDPQSRARKVTRKSDRRGPVTL